MKWNAFDLIEPAIEKTKRTLFPIKPGFWLKLGFVHYLSSLSILRGNFNLDSTNEGSNSIATNAINDIKSSGLLYYVIALMGLISIVFLYIGSIFSFVFLESISTNKIEIKKSYRKNRSKGKSLFGFLIFTGVFFIVALSIIFFPLIIQLVKNGSGFYLELSEVQLIMTIVPSIFIFIIFMIFYSFFMMFAIDISTIDAYKNDIKMSGAIKNTFKRINKQKKEALMYALSRFVIGIIAGVLGGIIFLPFLGIIMLGAYLSFLLFFLYWYFILIVSIPLLLALIYVFVVVTLPLNVFIRHFTILGYEKFYSEDKTEKITNKRKKRTEKDNI